MHKFLTWLWSLLSGQFANFSQAQAVKLHSNIALAMVALREPQLPKAEEIVEYIRKHWPDARSFGTAEIKDEVIFFTGEDGEVSFVTLMPFPIPWGDLEFPCKTTYNWSVAADEFKKMNSHAAISVMPTKGNIVEAHLRNTMLVQAVSALSKSLGVYWGEAASVWSPKEFKRLAIEMRSDDPPYVLWVGFKIIQENNREVSVYSVGMERFGSMNVEIQNSKAAPIDAFELVGDVSLYLLKSGAVIKDGETVGSDPKQKIRVSIGASIHQPNEMVYRLAY